MRSAFWKCPLLVCLSFGLTLFVLVNFPQTVLGSEFLYDEQDSEGLVVEVKAETGFFQTSKKKRLIKFYSPYCVSSCPNSCPRPYDSIAAAI